MGIFGDLGFGQRILVTGFKIIFGFILEKIICFRDEQI
jgi:hypothetical protein